MLKHTKYLLAAVVLAGCAAVTVDLPSITDSATDRHEQGSVVWRDLLTTTPEETRRFYSELFGWTFESPGIDLGFGTGDSYQLIQHKGRLIGGLFDARTLEADGNVSQWVTYLSVNDVDAAVASAKAGGGEIVTPPTELATRGTVAVLRDPEGALFAIVHARDGDPEFSAPQHNQFLWEELWTADVGQASPFYKAVFGFEKEEFPVDGSDHVYHVLSTAGEPRAGIMTNPFEGERPVWVNYLRVANPAAITSKVESLGGRIIVEAQPRSIGGTVALVAGPSGAGIALQTWPLDEEDGE